MRILSGSLLVQVQQLVALPRPKLYTIDLDLGLADTQREPCALLHVVERRECSNRKKSDRECGEHVKTESEPSEQEAGKGPLRGGCAAGR